MAEHRTKAWRWWEEYGAGMPRGDPRLRPVPSIPGRDCEVHWALAAVLRALMGDWLALFPHSPGLLVQSGWRPHRWRDRAQYEATCIQRYGSVAKGRIYLGYRSAHETGLAVDFGSPPPLKPDRRWVKTQRQSNIYGWLQENMPKYGLRWYVPEPWHVELPLPADVWRAEGPEAPLTDPAG